MKLLVFGATGPTGRQVVTQALAQGHEVTAFVRDPAGLELANAGLRTVVGDTTRDNEKIAAAVRGQDAVVSALGRGQRLKSENLIQRSLKAIAGAMESANVRRLVVVSAFGVGATLNDAPWVPRIMHRFLLKDLFADKEAAEDELRRGSLDWTLVYPTILTNGPVTGTYRVGERLELHGMPKISRADVAHFILGEVGKRAYVRKIAVISH
jgi:putative NADH-flavin reductase